MHAVKAHTIHTSNLCMWGQLLILVVYCNSVSRCLTMLILLQWKPTLFIPIISACRTHWWSLWYRNSVSSLEVVCWMSDDANPSAVKAHTIHMNILRGTNFLILSYNQRDGMTTSVPRWCLENISIITHHGLCFLGKHNFAAQQQSENWFAYVNKKL